MRISSVFCFSRLCFVRPVAATATREPADACAPPPARLRPVFAGQATGGAGHHSISASRRRVRKHKSFSIRASRRCIRSGRAKPSGRSCRPRNSILKLRCRTGALPWSRREIIGRRFQMAGDPKNASSDTSREAGGGEGAGVVGCSGQSDGSRKDVHRLHRCAT